MALAILNNTLKHTNLSLIGDTVMFNKIGLVMATLMAAYTTPALANWGDNWGEMAWGAPTAANVPMMGGLGMALLALALVAMAVKGLRSHSTLGLLLLVGVVGAVNNVEAQVTIPNTFSDGTPALASEVNANFQALASAVNASDCATAADVVCNPALSCPAAPACDTLGSYNLGFTDGGNGVDITSDNAAVCTTAGGTYDAGTDSCSVDITTDNAAAEAVAAAAGGSAACTQVGGTWDAETSTCTAPYNCFIGGYCSQAATEFPSLLSFYTNAYEGHTRVTTDGSGASCATASGLEQAWVFGRDAMLEPSPSRAEVTGCLNNDSEAKCASDLALVCASN